MFCYSEQLLYSKSPGLTWIPVRIMMSNPHPVLHKIIIQRLGTSDSLLLLFLQAKIAYFPAAANSTSRSHEEESCVTHLCARVHASVQLQHELSDPSDEEPCLDPLPTYSYINIQSKSAVFCFKLYSPGCVFFLFEIQNAWESLQVYELYLIPPSSVIIRWQHQLFMKLIIHKRLLKVTQDVTKKRNRNDLTYQQHCW